MEIKNRDDIRNFIIGIERDFPVNSWKFNDVHLWPIIRLNLYFQLIFKTEVEPKATAKPTQKPANKDNKKFSKIEILKRGLRYRKWLNSLKPKKFLFVGSDAHRTEYNGSFQNKFFDPLVHHFHLENTSNILEYRETPGKTIHNSNLSINYLENEENFEAFKKLQNYFSKSRAEIQLEGYDDLVNLLDANILTQSFARYNNSKNITQRITTFYLPHFENFTRILKKTKPEKLFMLCYYFDLGMLLISAANKLGIETFEMQHGPQTEEHLAYSGWSNIPAKGYDMLPRKFWNWDSASKRIIDKNFENHPQYSSFIGGNPWFEFMDFKTVQVSEHPFVLYTLQPSPVDLSDTFSESIVAVIKESPNKWLIKLHPRQNEDLEKIQNILLKNGLQNRAEIEMATPLPVLLANCLFNVTHYSGTALEAAMMGKKTVILSETGKKAFSDLIDRKEAVYINFKNDDFVETFSSFEKTTKFDNGFGKKTETNTEIVRKIFS